MPDQEPVPVTSEPAPRRIPSDGVFATAVLSPTRLLAVFYWARYTYYGKPLVLCDYAVGPLRADSWSNAASVLTDLVKERHSRLREPLGLYVETDLLSAQIASYGLLARVIPPWLSSPDAWHQIVQSAAGLLASGNIGYTKRANERMLSRPFLSEAGVAAGPRAPDDPTTAAFLYGIIIALDQAASRNPKPKQLVRASRK